MSTLSPLFDPDGHRWVRPGSPPCPNCQCCSAALCEKARNAYTLDQNCAYHGERSLWDQLTACPCPRAAWSDAQRDGTACVFCGTPVNRTDPARTRLIGMNGGLVAACFSPCVPSPVDGPAIEAAANAGHAINVTRPADTNGAAQ